MKKIALWPCLFLLVFFNTNGPDSYKSKPTDFFTQRFEMDYLDSEEISIREIIQTPDNKIYFLRDKEDYEFSDVEAHYLQPLLQPEYMKSILENDEKSHLSMHFIADRKNNKVQIEYSLTIPVESLNTLRQSVNGLEERWHVTYGEGCFADLFDKEPADCEKERDGNEINFYMTTKAINGDITKLNNRDEILKNPSFSVPIKTTIKNYYQKSDITVFFEKSYLKLEPLIYAIVITGMFITAPIWLPVSFILFLITSVK